MAATQVESFCERCGTKYTFDQRAERGRRLRGLGRTLGFLAEDSVLDDVPLASRDPFHGTFRFCLECRQYTCPSCWNETAGFCQGCAPLAHGADMTDAEAFAAVEAASDLRDAMSEVNLLRSAEAWPGIDLPPVSLMEPVSNGSEPHVDEQAPFESNGFDGMPFAPVIVSSDELFAGAWDALAIADEAADDEAEGDWSVVAAPEQFVEPVAEIEADEDFAVAEEAETVELAEPMVAALGDEAEPAVQLELEGEVETGAEYEEELEMVAEADAEVVADADLDVAAEAIADVDLYVAAEAVTDAEPEFVADGEPEMDFDAEPEFLAETEPELDFDAEGEPQPEFAADSEPTADVEFDGETTPEPEPEPLPMAAAAALEPEPEAEPAPAPPISAPRPVPSLLRPITELPTSPRPAAVTPPPATLPSSPTWMVPPTGAVSAPPTPPAATATPFVPPATPPMPPMPALPPAPSLFAQPTQPSMTPSAVPASRLAALFGRGHKPEPPPPPMPAPGALPSGWRITAEDTSPQYQSAAFLPQLQTPAPQVQPPRPTLLVQPGHGHVTPGIRPCFQCSLPLSSTARFCRRCGTPQQPTA